MRTKSQKTTRKDEKILSQIFGGIQVLENPSLQGICVDVGYRKTFELFVHNVLKKAVEISARITSG